MSNISNWTEGILLVLAFLAIITIIVANMNVLYDKNENIGLTDTSGAQQAFIDYQGSAEDQIEGGEVAFDAINGITLKSSYGITKDVMRIVWSFLSGGFIEQLALNFGAGDAGLVIAKTMRVLWFLSVVFALLYALFKIKV